MTDTIYESIIQTKSNSYIPLLHNGKSLESKYNPEREAETLFLQLEKKYNFYVLVGIGSGIFVNYIAQKYPEAKFLCIENSKSDIDFLMQIETFARLKSNKNITITTIDNLENSLIQSYIPALYGDIKIIFQKVWATENQSLFENCKQIIQASLTKISADYSVQAHFGKIWQRNIITNLKLLSENNSSFTLTPDISKTAVIIAAGPSLDSTINNIINHRNNYYLISTDTTCQSLFKYNITPDVVVSIDGQPVSCQHFFNIGNINTTFVFDLCSNSNITKKLYEKGNNVLFFSNGHPLSDYSSSYFNKELPVLYTGSGTVTIAAMDLAIKCGFKNIKVFGADFGYLYNKPYTKGTYLDPLYSKQSNNLLSLDKLFSRLMFRTELYETINNKKTTKTLESYKISLEEYLEQNKAEYSFENNIYSVNLNRHDSTVFGSCNFDFNNFIKSFNKENYVPLLPYIAWLRCKNEYKDLTFENLVNLALKDIVSYN